ncbi:MAG: succinyl-CoA synthetase subunit beta [Deltaproteobacteria bacterium RBG_13_52_11]|nr:MAG: succinyl-CoA synthetase subunit beta [Deltaproteobacteria bacterium RBG_13_52_11]
MRLYEYEGIDILESVGIPVPRRGVAETTEEALLIAFEIGYPVVLKAQVLVGGRGLAGGIKTVETPEELEEASGKLLNSEIKGLPVRKLLVCEQADILRELYMGITVDGFSGRPVIVVSTEGGVHIEKTARQSPDKIVSFYCDPVFGFYPYQARMLLRRLGLSERLLTFCADVLIRLYRVFSQFEALIAEINPLVILKTGYQGGLLAVDSVLEIDNSALSRIKYSLPQMTERIENPLERKGREIGVTYVDLEGDIGIISSGAGLGMATMDIIGERLRPANFLETGGGITEELLYKCMELVMMKVDLRAIFINIYGGINPIHEGARGVVRYIKEHHVTLPIVAKALGNHQEETWEILRSGGVHVVTEAPTEIAVDRLFELVGKK